MAKDGQLKEILKLLIENTQEKFSIRKISKIQNINYKSAYNAVHKLKQQGIVEVEKVGNTSICSFNFKFNSLVFSAEYERRQALLKNKNIKILQEQLSRLNEPFIALLFGSYAKKKNTAHSDIDILIISQKESYNIATELSILALPIHPTDVTIEDFIRMAKSKEFTVVSEAIKNNVVLVGIEEYYRLLDNAYLLVG
jgi:predicted nucleotidyltransferase